IDSLRIRQFDPANEAPTFPLGKLMSQFSDPSWLSHLDFHDTFGFVDRDGAVGRQRSRHVPDSSKVNVFQKLHPTTGIIIRKASNHYFPFQTGSRFSAKALKPSRLSSEA